MPTYGITEIIFPDVVVRPVFQRPIDVVLEEHRAVLARREAARLAFAAADADARALTAIISEQGSIDTHGASLDYDLKWLQAAECASRDFYRTPLPEPLSTQLADAHRRWSIFVADARRMGDSRKASAA